MNIIPTNYATYIPQFYGKPKDISAYVDRKVLDEFIRSDESETAFAKRIGQKLDVVIRSVHYYYGKKLTKIRQEIFNEKKRNSLIDLYQKGYSPSEISNQLNISSKQVMRALERFYGEPYQKIYEKRNILRKRSIISAFENNFSQGKSLKSVVEETGSSIKIVNGYLQEVYGAKFSELKRNVLSEKYNLDLVNKVKLYRSNNFSINQIAKLTGKSTKTISYILSKHNIVSPREKLMNDFDDIVISHIKQGFNSDRIAKEYKVPKRAVEEKTKNSFGCTFKVLVRKILAMMPKDEQTIL